MAQDAGSKITGNEEWNNKQEQSPAEMFAELNKITQVLTQNREEAHSGIVTIDQKLNGLKAEALTSVNTLRTARGGSGRSVANLGLDRTDQRCLISWGGEVPKTRAT